MRAPAQRIVRSFAAAIAVVAAIVCLAGRASAAPSPRAVGAGQTPTDTNTPAELEGIDIVDRSGQDVPRDAALVDQAGRKVKLGDYFDGKRPVVLALAYYECPMLCSLVLKGILDSLKEINWTAGDEYRVVVVSFDPRDTPERAAAKRQSYLEAYGRKVGDRGWDFLVGDEATVRRVADSVGFRYRWDEREKQFAHAAGAFVITPSGRISRTLYGMAFPGLRLALLEGSEGKIGAVTDKFLLFCFHYDPASRGYVLATVRLMKAGGALTMLALGALFLRLWRGERRGRRAGGSSQRHEGGDPPPVPGPVEPLPERHS